MQVDRAPVISESIKRAKKKCFERMLDLGLKHEIPTDKSQKVDVQIPTCSGPYIVFINGIFCQELSQCEGFHVVPLLDAFKTYSTLFSNAFSKASKECTNPYALLNAATCDEGVFIMASTNGSLQIISIIDAENSSMTPRLHIFVKPNVEVAFVHTRHVIRGNRCLYNKVIDIALEEGARCTFESVDFGSETLDYREHVEGTLKRASFLKATFVEDAPMVHRTVQVTLSGEGAEAECSGAWFLDGTKINCTTVTIDHQEPHCRSMQHFKGVLQGSAVSHFSGKIVVRKKAQKTSGYQLNKNLLLSDQAVAKVDPNLEIFADDVKASHGATIGKLDDEHLFYLKSRGLTENQAKAFLVNGFCEEVVAKLSLRSLQDKAYESIRKIV